MQNSCCCIILLLLYVIQNVVSNVFTGLCRACNSPTNSKFTTHLHQQQAVSYLFNDHIYNYYHFIFLSTVVVEAAHYFASFRITTSKMFYYVVVDV